MQRKKQRAENIEMYEKSLCVLAKELCVSAVRQLYRH
jgi:hypothetical protein